MKEHYRAYPEYAACGLNCGLCPRYHTQGISRCPDAAGRDFTISTHPAPLLTAASATAGWKIVCCAGNFPAGGIWMSTRRIPLLHTGM